MIEKTVTYVNENGAKCEETHSYKMSFDYVDYILRYDRLYENDVIFLKDSFKENDGREVPIVYTGNGHSCYDASNHLGFAVLENREDGVIAKCTFAKYDTGLIAKDLIVNTKEFGISVYANRINYDISQLPIRKVQSANVMDVIAVPSVAVPRVKE